MRDNPVDQEISAPLMKMLTKAGIGLTVLIALLLGMWINKATWKDRKFVWQLQGALLGGAVGFVAGRVRI